MFFDIVKGNEKFTSKDRCNFFDIVYGSALECSGYLDNLFAMKISESVKANLNKWFQC